MQIHLVDIDPGKTAFHLVTLGATNKVLGRSLPNYARMVTLPSGDLVKA
jgi:hypothetical protein